MNSRAKVLAIGAAVVLIAFAVRVAYVRSFDPEFVNVDQYGNLADSLYQGQGFTISSADDIGAERVEPPVRYPTAKRTPGLPLFVALQYRLFGHRPFLALMVQCLVDALACLLTFVLARRFLGGPWLAGLAALGYALYPPELFMVVRLWTEPLFTVLLVGGTLVALACRGRVSTPLAFAVGLLRGAGVLVRPGLLLFLLFEAPWLAGGGGRRLRRVAAYLCGCALVLAPWVARNAYVFDGWIGVTTYGGYNLYVGHDETRNGRYYDYSLLPEELKDRLHGRSEPEQDRVLREAAIERIRANGMATELRLFGLKALRFCFNVDRATDRPSLKSLAVNSLLLGLALIGTLALLFRSREKRPPRWPLLAPIVYFFLLHCAIVARLRFLFPLLPFLLVLAVLGIRALWPGRRAAGTAGE